MREYFTEAIVLGRNFTKEFDAEVDLYTKELGRIRAKVIGVRKPLSKFAPHLDFLNLVTVRLVKKKRFTVTDAFTADRFREMRKNNLTLGLGLRLAFLFRKLLPEGGADSRLWHALRRAFQERAVRIRAFLRLLGYDPLHAACDGCGSTRIAYFYTGDQSFICAVCALKCNERELVLL